MNTHETPETTASPTPQQPPVNYVQLAVSLLAIALIVTNVITWLYYKDALKQPGSTEIRGETLAIKAPPAVTTANGSPIDLTTRNFDFPITNAHDHLYKLQHLDKYMKAAKKFGIDRTIFVASSEFTFLGTKGDPKKLNDWSTREILTAAKKYPGKIIPFATLHPDDPDKVALLKSYVADGVMGLKLYTGHSNFHDRSLDVPEMDPVYAYCAETQLPVLWHVNMAKYTKELFTVLDRYPTMKVIIPHYGVGFWRPEGNVMGDVEKMLDTYPNVYVDSSFGTREILVGGLEKVSAHLEVFKDFYAKYQDRIVWGTDMVVTGNSEKTEPWVESVIRACRDVHEKDTYVFWMAAQGSKYAYGNGSNTYGVLRGLNLSDEILEKVYKTNMDRLLGIGK